ncbi:sorting nexin-25-like [Pecten maximus]|uniref:sorting nexin-25-like n=1 Tax=Pecten maximus TaxID=6579 RepID=UPI00145916E1|nr:sorting nexin-25-like [Pecten maximus]XP_033743125.1 sorting nexin-25-like [Pecten maximus]
MNTAQSIVLGCGGLVLAILYQYDFLFTTIFVVLHLLVIAAGIFLGSSWSLVRGKQYKPTSAPPEESAVNTLIQKLMERKADKRGEPKKVVISRNIDLALQEVIDLSLRDFVLTWYEDLSKDQESLLTAIKGDVWIVIKQLSTRLSKVDMMKLITQDVVEKLHSHFTEIRTAAKSSDSNVGDDRKFSLHPWLASEASERQFLSQLCEVLLLIFLPDNYNGCTTIRHILREIITSSGLQPMVDMVCDPDYINEKLIAYIDYRRQVSEDTRRTYLYAANYEDFVKMIGKCEDIEHLKQIRYNIITEIIQATTIKNLQQEQAGSGKPGSPKGMAKGELLKSRNLKRYINQLTVAKSKCEKRIRSLGGPDYKYYTDNADGDCQVEKVMTFSEVMDSPLARQEFFKFLKRDDNESLLGFWNAVEKLRSADKRQHHQLGSDIFYQYISSSSSVVKTDRSLIKTMETFLKGDTGPDAFFEAQDQVYQVLQKDHYPSFLVSDIYYRFIISDDYERMDAACVSSKDQFFFGPTESFLEPEDEEDSDNEDLFASESYAAQQRLETLDEKIRNKTQAIQALKTKKTDDAKIGKVEKDMEKERENLMDEKKQLEAHIHRMQMWCENQGKWRAHVYETETFEVGEKKTPVFVLIIHLVGAGMSQNLQKSSHGWVVSRTLPEFHKMHRQLVQIGSWLKKKDLPTIGRFTTVDDKFILESKSAINEYLIAVMKDERMAQSEVLCRFLTPTPSYLKQQETAAKKRTFFLDSLLKSLPKIGQESHENEDELLFSGDDSTKLDRSKDSIAEPFYKLVNEVFELRGMFKWLRKSFIAFVEVSFGRSINRQLRDTVDWIFSEPMIIYYIRMFKDSMWPEGKLAPYTEAKSDEKKFRTRMEAKEKFLTNIPDALKSLLGENNARRGSIKVFEVLQDTRLNKHLFYILLELVLMEICPELNETETPLSSTEVLTL